MKYMVKKQYRFACSCGCNEVVHSFSKRKANRDAQGEISEVWAVLPTRGNVVADCYDEKQAIRVAAALSK